MFDILCSSRSHELCALATGRIETKRAKGSVSTKLLALTIALVLLGSRQLFAQSALTDFDFINVADTTSQGFTSFATFPRINNRGTVVFVASRNLSEGGIFKWQKGELTTLASTSDGTIRGFGISPAINKSGTVCFEADLRTGAQAYFIADDTSLTKILDTHELGFTSFVGDPAINSAGTCAFAAVTNFLPHFKIQQSIFAGTRTGLTTVVDTKTSGFTQFGNVAINASGEVAFLGFRQDGSSGVFVAHSDADDSEDDTSSVTPQPLLDIVDSNTDPAFAGAFFGDPVINRSGTVADVAFLNNGVTPLGGLEIFTADGKGVTARTDPTSPLFIDSEHPSIKDAGVVAFSVTLSAGGNAILVESTGGASPVTILKTGDSLFGSTVTTLFVGRFALNNHNKFVFQYGLQDGRSGVAIAALHGDNDD